MKIYSVWCFQLVQLEKWKVVQLEDISSEIRQYVFERQSQLLAVISIKLRHMIRISTAIIILKSLRHTFISINRFMFYNGPFFSECEKVLLSEWHISGNSELCVLRPRRMKFTESRFDNNFHRSGTDNLHWHLRKFNELTFAFPYHFPAYENKCEPNFHLITLFYIFSLIHFYTTYKMDYQFCLCLPVTTIF